MSFMMLLSNGVIVSMRGSGTPIVASWLIGILVPYALTWTRSSSVAAARPVRTVVNSWRAFSTLLSILRVASFNTSSIMS